jgi:hypothetical protein
MVSAAVFFLNKEYRQSVFITPACTGLKDKQYGCQGMQQILTVVH